MCAGAGAAFALTSYAGPAWSAALLQFLADRVEEDRAGLIAIADRESRLGEGRLEGELTRTVGQLRQFAELASTNRGRIERHDPPDPSGLPAPSPDLQRIRIPIGPIAVFAASNFPLAFGVAGGDTAAAFAAGCPVIARAHPLQIETARRLALCVRRALVDADAPPEWFDLVDEVATAAGLDLVRHPAIAAIAFTGSFGAGMALTAAAADRAVPIPVYAEMGSLNPLFVTHGAAEERGAEIAHGLAASITLGVGQFCTKPGLVVVPASAAGERLVAMLTTHLHQVAAAPMLSVPMAQEFRRGFSQRAALEDVAVLVEPHPDEGRDQGPGLLTASPGCMHRDHLCFVELFGPAAVVVASDVLADVCASLPGSLTATIHSVHEEHDERRSLMRSLTRVAGRIVHNGYPTGVAVKPAMHHGGPFPSSTHPWATSVGLAAVERFQRPVVIQSWPETWSLDALAV